MGYSLAVFLQAAFCMQSYCHVVFAVCKKMINMIRSTLLKVSVSALEVVSHLLSPFH